MNIEEDLLLRLETGNFPHFRSRIYGLYFEKFTTLYALKLTNSFRVNLEKLLLTFGVIQLCILGLAHYQVENTAEGCGKTLTEGWDGSGVLRLEIINNLEQNERGERFYHKWYNRQYCYFDLREQLIWGSTKRQCNFYDTINYYEDEVKMSSKPSLKELSTSDKVANFFYFMIGVGEVEEIPNTITVPEGYLHGSFHINYLSEVYQDIVQVLEITEHEGLFHLKSPVRKLHNIPTKFVRIDPEKHVCFTNLFYLPLVNSDVRYDMILINALRKIKNSGVINEFGYIRDVASGVYYSFMAESPSIWEYIYLFVKMTFCIAVVSLILEDTHEKLIFLCFQVMHVNHWENINRTTIAGGLTCLLAIIGMEGMLFDILKHSMLSFNLIMIIWAADSFYTMACLSPLSKKMWPRFFYFYLYSFCLYQNGNARYYPNIALAALYFFVLHSMVYFYHHFEFGRIVHRAARRVMASNNVRFSTAETPNQEGGSTRRFIARFSNANGGQNIFYEYVNGEIIRIGVHARRTNMATSPVVT